jgi:hypothetical protein
MKIIETLGRLDRRIIYLLLTLAVIVPLLVNIDVRQRVDRSTETFFRAVDTLDAENKAVLISFDYSPDVAAELDPMAMAILRHCFARGIKVVGLSFSVQGAALGERAMARAAREYGKEYGKEYCYFGYRIGVAVTILGLGENPRRILPADHYGSPYDSLPMMAGIGNYDDIGLVVDLAGSGIVQSWIVYAHNQYRANVAAGVTAVVAPDYYPYLQTGQLVGQLGGMRGAAEYEQLVYDAGYHPSKGLANKAMNAISSTHVLIMLLIVVGNLAFWQDRRGNKQK